MLRILFAALILNLVGFFIMFWDKRKAKNNEMRIPEKTLMLTALIGGSIGMLTGMYTFHHKTQKSKFKYGVPFILILQIILIVYAFVKLR